MLGLVRLHQDRLSDAEQDYQQVLSGEFYEPGKFDLHQMADEIRQARRTVPDLPGADRILELIEQKHESLAESAMPHAAANGVESSP